MKWHWKRWFLVLEQESLCKRLYDNKSRLSSIFGESSQFDSAASPKHPECLWRMELAATLFGKNKNLVQSVLVSYYAVESLGQWGNFVY